MNPLGKKDIKTQAEELVPAELKKITSKISEIKVTAHGRAWKELKQGVKTLIRSAKSIASGSPRWISTQTHRNEKLQKKLPDLMTNVKNLSTALKTIKTQTEEAAKDRLYKDLETNTQNLQYR